MIEIDKNKCTGCGLCAAILPEVFELGDDGKSRVKDKEGDKKYPEKVKEAVESCPVGAIKIKA